MTYTLHNYPVMLHLRCIFTSNLPNDKCASQQPWVTNTPQMKHHIHRIIVKRIGPFVSQMILYLGPLLQCRIHCLGESPHLCPWLTLILEKFNIKFLHIRIQIQIDLSSYTKISQPAAEFAFAGHNRTSRYLLIIIFSRNRVSQMSSVFSNHHI
jgi:hypothetical protein